MTRKPNRGSRIIGESGRGLRRGMRGAPRTRRDSGVSINRGSRIGTGTPSGKRIPSGRRGRASSTSRTRNRGAARRSTKRNR